MSTVTTLEWTPVDASDKELKSAFSAALVASPSSVIVRAPDGKTNRFILQTNGYHDIYLYVVEGIKFISSKDEFEKTFPKSAFATVNIIDGIAYNFLRDSTTSISAHTADFNANGLGRLITSANGAIAYADHCIGLLKEKTDMSLYKHLDIILDEKYKTPPMDGAFMEAVELARMAVQSLSKVAKEKAEDAKTMVALLKKFHTLTTNDAKNVEAIQQDWLKGSKQKRPYCEIMDEEVTRLQKQILDSQKKRDEENDKWAAARDKAITLGVLGIFCIWMQIGTGIETDKAIRAKNEYNRLVDLIKKDEGDRAVIVSVLELVRGMIMHLENILPKMRQAITAMEELQGLFTEQDLNFQIVDQKLGVMQNGIEGKSFKARKLWILSSIDDAVEKFVEAQYSCKRAANAKIQAANS
ncbi:hypothetical protein GGR51DRAFT_566723 [Nemania sp. FL0031]|nr:hypothetical protein GGR51DRAFT_566723 [Nemania sp. FL0031]